MCRACKDRVIDKDGHVESCVVCGNDTQVTTAVSTPEKPKK